MCGEPLILTAERKAILNAAVERLIPSDDGPGAVETQVILYIEQALKDRSWRFFLPLLDRGLDFLQSIALHQHEKGFMECTVVEQNQVLKTAQRFPNNEARQFFNHLLDLALEGFLCDPKHGGNRDRLGWQYVGYKTIEHSICEAG